MINKTIKHILKQNIRSAYSISIKGTNEKCEQKQVLKKINSLLSLNTNIVREDNGNVSEIIGAGLIEIVVFVDKKQGNTYISHIERIYDNKIDMLYIS